VRSAKGSAGTRFRQRHSDLLRCERKSERCILAIAASHLLIRRLIWRRKPREGNPPHQDSVAGVAEDAKVSTPIGSFTPSTASAGMMSRGCCEWQSVCPALQFCRFATVSGGKGEGRLAAACLPPERTPAASARSIAGSTYMAAWFGASRHGHELEQPQRSIPSGNFNVYSDQIARTNNEWTQRNLSV
jgi:hypothetical protein